MPWHRVCIETYSCVPSDHNDRIVSVYIKKVRITCQLIGGEKKTNRVYRSVRFDRPVELHGSSSLLDNFGILSMQPSLLVFLHPSNFFLKSGDFLKIKKVNMNIPLYGSKKTHVPFLGSFIFVGVACWG